MGEGFFSGGQNFQDAVGVVDAAAPRSPADRLQRGPEACIGGQARVSSQIGMGRAFGQQGSARLALRRSVHMAAGFRFHSAGQ